MSVLKSMLASKKFCATIAGVVITIAGKIGFDLPAETTNQVIALIASYVVGQGVADHGKHRNEEAAKK